MKDADGIPIRVGDRIGFKQNVELTGTVKAIRCMAIVVEYNDPVTDEPRTTTVSPERCWHD